MASLSQKLPCLYQLGTLWKQHCRSVALLPTVVTADCNPSRNRQHLADLMLRLPLLCLSLPLGFMSFVYLSAFVLSLPSCLLGLSACLRSCRFVCLLAGRCCGACSSLSPLADFFLSLSGSLARAAGLALATILAGREAAAADGGSASAPRDFSKMSAKLLKKLLRDAGEDCLGCSDKREFVAKAEVVLGAAAKQQPPPEHDTKEDL